MVGTPYCNLNDAAYLEQGLQYGPVQIWYTKGEHFFRFNSRSAIPAMDTLEDTHSMIGSIIETDKDEIFGMLQGETWSPRGEAWSLIDELGVAHTSMSVGDVIVIGEQAWVCAPVGWEELD